MANKKVTLKKLMAASSAMVMAGAMIMAIPIMAFAEDLGINPEGETIDVKNGDTLEVNLGTVTNNYGTIVENSENGIVEWTSSRSTIETNYGYVDFQTGTFHTNNGTVKYNTNPSATIDINNKTVEYNRATINHNNGRVINNIDYGEILDGNPAENQWWSVDFGGAYDSMLLVPEYDESSDWGGPYEGDQYLKAAEGEEGIIVLRAADGYQVTTGNGEEELPTTCKCTARKDGNNYVITISSITGYTYLSLQSFNLIVESIQQSSGESTNGGTVTVVVDDSVRVIPSEGGSRSSDSSSSEAPADAITISLPRTTASTAVATAGPTVLGASREAARSAAFKMAKLTDAQYKDAVIKNLSVTPAGGLFRLETDRIACFDRAMLEAFAKKGNVDMEVLFPLGGKKLSVMIPAGTDINKLLDDKGYCGFLRLLAILGGEFVIK